MIRSLKVIATCALTCALLSSQSFAQSVSLNVPSAWSTLRTDSVIVKAQVDTAGLKQKQIDYTLSSVIGGATKVIAQKQVKVTDVSSDAFLAKINSNVLGGTDYLKVEWVVDSQKNEILPVGIVNLEKLPKLNPVQAKFVQENAILKEVADSTKEEHFNKCGTKEYAVFWNSKALFYVLKKSSDSSALSFSIDGKNGKNAFVSYPDRFIECKKDSVRGYHYKRNIENSALKYTELNWENEISKEIIGNKIVIKMPWFDTGIVPFDGRVIGFSAFRKDKNKVVSSNPEKALEFIPGTWGNLVLSK